MCTQTSRVLIVSDRDDVHARAVMSKLRDVSGIDSPAVLFDTATFPMATDLALQPMATSALAVYPALPRLYGGATPSILREAGRDVKTLLPLERIRSVYWRRPRPGIIDDILQQPELRRYAAKSSRESIEGVIESLALNCVVVDPASAVSRAGLKTLQMDLARRVGLTVPRTLVTNSPNEARRFIEIVHRSGAEVVSKSPADVSDFAAQTELVENLAPDAAQLIRFSPTIFQERIKNGPDLRITVVGERLFGMSQTPSPEFQDVDCRADVAPRQKGFEAPQLLREQILAMQKYLGLSFGAYDFKCDSTDAPYFLEVNPGGQWLFVEVATDQPIAEALARYLWHGRGAEWTTCFPAIRNYDLDALYPFSMKDEYEALRRTVERDGRNVVDVP